MLVYTLMLTNEPCCKLLPILKPRQKYCNIEDCAKVIGTLVFV